MKMFLLGCCALLAVSCSVKEEETSLRIWFDAPAERWTEALPVGNGRLGAMVFGGVEKERIQFNEETLWTGEPNDYAHKGAHNHLHIIRQLLSEGKQEEAQTVAMNEFMSVPLRQMSYQPFGDLLFEFPDHAGYTGYHRELDIENAICYTSYKVGDIAFHREVIASHPHQAIVVHLTASQNNALSFQVGLDAGHEEKAITTEGNGQTLHIAVKDGSLKGVARIVIETDGDLTTGSDRISISNAGSATVWLSAATNFAAYDDLSNDPDGALDEVFGVLQGKGFEEIKNTHVSDYRQLWDRFSLNFGNSLRDTLPTNQRLLSYAESPDDPQLLALYTQYGRYLMISSSREGTMPANLQGIWNKDPDPAWGSKYTVNINTEMNYWPAEVTNLSECHEPLFSMIRDCAVTGTKVAREHYNCEGWVVHHNTDLWRGAAPINHSNHGMWVGGSGWLVHHLWEHYLFTMDTDFLREQAYPLMKGAALFYSEFLIEDPVSGWLISTPSNSPENGGMVAGPTMDHQIIRSLFTACTEAAGILGVDDEFASVLKEQVSLIAPNQVGRHGQLQEWLEDRDDPGNIHRHVSHLWGFHPAEDINRETGPELVEAARQSLLFRGDEGTGWSLAWKINFWARFLDGDHAYDLIKMIFRPVETGETKYGGGGGSYPNLFDAHPPFQIDGNFGAAAGIVEMLVQSHLSAIDILPALPSALPEGNISGVCARGGFELSFSWTGGMLSALEVKSNAGEDCRIRYRDQVVEFETIPGGTYRFDGDLNRI